MGKFRIEMVEYSESKRRNQKSLVPRPLSLAVIHSCRILPTYGSFPGQASRFDLAPAIGKKGPLEIPGPPRSSSSSSDSSRALLAEPIGQRIRDGAGEVSTVEGPVVPRIELVPDLEGGMTASFGTGGFGVASLESGLKVDDTLRNAMTFFPKELKIPDDVGSWSVCPLGCSSLLGPG